MLGTLQDLYVGNLILPADAKNAKQATEVEAMESLFRPYVGGSSLATIDGAEHTCLVDSQHGLPREAGFIHTLWCTLEMTVTAFAILLLISAYRVSKLEIVDPRYVVVHRFQPVAIDCNPRGMVRALHHYIGLLQIDDQSEFLVGEVQEAVSKLLEAVLHVGNKGCIRKKFADEHIVLLRRRAMLKSLSPIRM